MKPQFTFMELIIILIFLPKRMSILAKERGRSSSAWTLAAIGSLLGGEFLIMLLWFVIYTIGVILFSWPANIERQPVTFAVYVTALVGGLVCADLVRRRLMSKPIVRHDVKQWGGILS